MPRNGSGVYSKPAGTTAVSGTTIESAKYNSVVDDLVTDANTPRPIVAGGTGATTGAGILAATGVTASVAEVNTLDGITASTAELNILDGATLTVTELNYVDGVTSAIQAQLNAKQATITTLALANGGTGAALVDPGADRLMFWDDSAGATAYLTAGTGLTITGTTITASAGRVLLASKTASASATLDFTEFNNATYRYYEFIFEQVKPATDNVSFSFRTSTNGGSSYDSGGSDYGSITEGFSAAGSANAAGLGNVGSITRTALGNQATEFGVTGEVTLYFAGDATKQTRLMGQISYETTTPNLEVCRLVCDRQAAQDTDAIRFLMSSGNIASGTIRMYGVAE